MSVMVKTGPSTWEQVAGNAKDVNIIDNLMSTDTESALSANQGRILNNRIPFVEDNLESTDTESALSANQGRILNNRIPFVEDNLESTYTETALSANQGRILNNKIESGIKYEFIRITFYEGGISDIYVNGNKIVLSARIIDGHNDDIANRGIRISIIGGDNGHGTRLWLYNEFTNERIGNQTHNCLISYIDV